MSAATDTQTAWQTRCSEVADWARQHLVNRTDRHGLYIDTDVITAGELTDATLKNHFFGGKIIGLHSTAANNTCKWLGLDIDNHDGDDGLATSNFDVAVGLLNRLTELGIAALLEDSNGDGGYHIWILFSRPAPAADVYRFAQWLIDGKDIETFPKQAALSGKGLGNWLRLMGRHHSRNHWSRAYGDNEWLDDAESVEALLCLPANDPSVLDVVPDEPPAEEDDQSEAPEPKAKPKPDNINGTETLVDIAERTIEQTSWRDLLEPQGWRLDSTSGTQSQWTRPGKTSGVSATLNHDGRNLFYVFTTGTELDDGTSYGKWRFYCWSIGLAQDQVAAAKKYLGADVVAEHDRKWRESQQHGTNSTTGEQSPESQTSGDDKNPPLWTVQRLGNILTPPSENEPVIDGMLRRAEVGSTVAVPKAAKSWLMMQLSMSVIEGKPWLGRDTTQGHVLLVDNELRPNTICDRASRVARTMGTSQAAIDERFSFVALRGVDFDFRTIEWQLEKLLTDKHTLIVFDAKYRFFSGLEENSNSDNTVFHNAVDRWSQRFNVAIELVHHSSKGNQGGKSITDVGAGGGAQSRATDCHTVLREHEEPGMFVLESELRTFRKPEPQSVQFNFPLWEVVGDVEPVVKQAQSRSDEKNEKCVKDKIGVILQMLRLATNNTHSENKLSGNHPSSPTYRAAINILTDSGEIEWVDEFREPRSPSNTGGWHLTSPTAGESNEGIGHSDLTL